MLAAAAAAAQQAPDTTHQPSVVRQQAGALLATPVRSAAANLKSTLQAPTQLVKGGLHVTNVTVDVMAGVMDLSNLNTDGSLYPPLYGTYNVAHTRLGATVTLFNVPLQVGYQYEYTQGPGVMVNLGTLTTTFDKNAYISGLKARLQGKFNPADYLPQQYLSIDRLEQAALTDLHTDIGNIQRNYGSHLPLNAAGLGDWKTVTETDQATLERLILPDSLQHAIAANKVRLTQLQASKNQNQPIDTVEYNKILSQNHEAEGYRMILQKVQEYRNKWAASGFTAHLRQLARERGIALANIAKDPGVIAQAARQNLSLNGVEKIFMDMKGLNLGRGVADQSAMTLSQSVMQNGLNTELLGSASKLFSVTGGHMPSQGSSYESVFAGNGFNPDMAMASLGAGKGTPGDNAARVSIMSFKSTAASGLQGMLPTGGGLQSFVLTFSKDLRIGDHGHLNTEFSKSLAPGTGGIQSDFFKTLGVAVDYNNEFPKLGLSHDLRLSSAAADYSNPGNAYLFSGMKEAASSIQQVLLHRQMTITLRNAVTAFSMGGDDRFTQYTNLLSVRWRLKKGNYVALKFQPSWSSQTIDGIRSQAGAITRLSTDVNYNAKIAKDAYQSFTSLAYVRNTFPSGGTTLGLNLLNTTPPITSFQLTSQQTLQIRQSQVYFNNTAGYTRQRTAYVYLNSTWNTEAGYRYPVKGSITAATGLNYTTVTGWYTQAGIRQSLSGRINNRMTLGGSVDVGKNLKVDAPYPVPGFRGDLRMSYHF